MKVTAMTTYNKSSGTRGTSSTNRTRDTTGTREARSSSNTRKALWENKARSIMKWWGVKAALTKRV